MSDEMTVEVESEWTLMSIAINDNAIRHGFNLGHWPPAIWRPTSRNTLEWIEEGDTEI